MKIILADDIETLGHKGDVVVVSDGYARNFLIPKGMALTASKGALKQAEMMQKARGERMEKEKDEAAAKVAVLAANPVYISARAGEEGRLFGSVTKTDVARGIEDQLGEVVDHKMILLDDPIRSLGTHSVEIKLHEQVNALVTVEVISHDEE
ncbi:MAG: 50S ribosomal protein L9 [Actinobacteria bacterium]|jgi:large subunit ribosomal protein L9|nr:50S ribosomal protein L9 [Actinomycetota bacterium]